MAKRVKRAKISGLLDTLKGFERLLQEMQKRGERERSGSGQTTIVGLPTKYRYHIRLGVKPRNFFLPKRYGGSQASREKVEIKRIVLSAPDGEMTNDISIPNCKVEGELFREGTLEIVLKRRK